MSTKTEKTEDKKIKTVRPGEIDKGTLKAIASKLAMGNSMLSQGKKMSDQAKESIARWLKENRDIELSSMGIGEMVQIEDILLVEIGKQERFDETAFSTDQEKLYLEYKKEFPIRKFKSLV